MKKETINGATLAIAADRHPYYLRFGRESVPVVTTPDTPFVIGKANTMREGKDLAIIACGVSSPLKYRMRLPNNSIKPAI